MSKALCQMVGCCRFPGKRSCPFAENLSGFAVCLSPSFYVHICELSSEPAAKNMRLLVRRLDRSSRLKKASVETLKWCNTKPSSQKYSFAPANPSCLEMSKALSVPRRACGADGRLSLDVVEINNHVVLFYGQVGGAVLCSGQFFQDWMGDFIQIIFCNHRRTDAEILMPRRNVLRSGLSYSTECRSIKVCSSSWALLSGSDISWQIWSGSAHEVILQAIPAS